MDFSKLVFWKKEPVEPHICDIRPIDKIYITPPTSQQILSLKESFVCDKNIKHEVQPVRVETFENSIHYYWNCVSCYNDNEAIRNTYERIITEAMGQFSFNNIDDPEVEPIFDKLTEAEQYFQV